MPIYGAVIGVERIGYVVGIKYSARTGSPIMAIIADESLQNITTVRLSGLIDVTPFEQALAEGKIVKVRLIYASPYSPIPMQIEPIETVDLEKVNVKLDDVIVLGGGRILVQGVETFVPATLSAKNIIDMLPPGTRVKALVFAARDPMVGIRLDAIVIKQVEEKESLKETKEQVQETLEKQEDVRKIERVKQIIEEEGGLKEAVDQRLMEEGLDAVLQELIVQGKVRLDHGFYVFVE